MKCQSIKKNNKKICISDFNKKIKIQIYSLQVSNVAETQIGFVDLAEVWAFVKTISNASFIANVNIDVAVTIEFYIRYIDYIDLNNQIFIEYEGKRFKINSIENIDKDNEVIVFRAIERGKQELDANRI
jgi:SPP1 family predicted phage head-tail adaptor